MPHTDPFTGPAPKRIPLPHAPLSGVLAQARFEEVFSITKKEFVADFQDCLRKDYPIHKEDQNKILAVSGSSIEQRDARNWRFFDAHRQWRVSLTTTFISIETRAYTSRDDFIDRFGKILKALQDTIGPNYQQRIGVRYVDRISGEPFKKLGDLVRPELAGFASSPLRKYVLQSLHESQCEVEEGTLIARWGMLPDGGTHDPDLMPPINEPSWMLDIDVFRDSKQGAEPFDADVIRDEAYSCATRVYSFFRWAVTEEFLKEYGGKV
ncbi:TIGR04255 family protein [Nitratireductor sp. XY-223]|uniref:TIGR04255 family protein n=1 Tax=Nitratireductor sp. XY-223 TaxID=2561926 RepID=UPI0010AA2BF1|nr:TIGR04255 family protein [Nitratireductor sp. XY-223]